MEKLKMVETYKLFRQDPNKRTRGELVGCFRELSLAISAAKEMGLKNFSIKLNPAQCWEFWEGE
jgi:hypothetical protein